MKANLDKIDFTLSNCFSPVAGILLVESLGEIDGIFGNGSFSPVAGILLVERYLFCLC